jgi:gliding motility-associated-like protein
VKNIKIISHSSLFCGAFLLVINYSLIHFKVMKQRISYFLVALLISISFTVEAQPPTTGWVVLDNFGDGNFTADPQWNVVNPSDPWTVNSGVLRVNDLNGSFALSTPFTRVVDAWDFDYVMDGGFQGQILDYFFFMTAASNDPRNASGYRVRYQLGNTSNVVSLQTITNGVVVNTIASFNNGLTNGLPKISVVRKNNTWEFYVGSTLRGTGTDGTYSNSIGAYQGLFVFLPNSSVPYQHGFDNIRYREIPFGPFASAVFLGTCRQPAGSFFNTTGTGVDLIDQNNKTFTDTFFGTYIQNSGALVFKGAEVKTFKGANANVCIPKMYYRIIPQGTTPGSFSNMDLNNIIENCSVNTFPTTGGPCNPGDQKWQRNDSSIDLTNLPAGNYTLEVYYEVTGSSTSATTGCGETIVLNNNGNNFKATYTILSTPTLGRTNTKYAVTYKDDGTTVTPDSLTSNASGDILINSLNAGVYTEFSFSNGCTIAINGSVNLTDPSLTLTPSSTPNTVCGGTPGGGTTPCTYTGPKVVINEIMVMPGSNYNTSGGGDNSSPNINSMLYKLNDTGQEWVELYNPSPCDPIDLSCYILGAKTSSSNWGSVSFPPNTIIPPLGFLVVGGGLPFVNINLNTLNRTYIESGTSIVDPRPFRWHLENGSGWLALYDKNLSIIDGVYWADGADAINDRGLSRGNAFEYTLPYPVGNDCNYVGTIDAPMNMVSSFKYIGNNSNSNVGAQTIGKSTYRSTDGGNTWIVGGIGAANNTPGICNATCTPPFTGGGGSTGTCTGSATATITGSGNYTIEWKDASNNAIGSTATISNLCPGIYTVTVKDNGTNCTKTETVIVADGTVKPTVTVNSPSVCTGANATVTATPNPSTGTYSYKWAVPAGVTDPGNVSSFTTTTAGDYKVIVTNTTTKCTSDEVTGTVTIKTIGKPVITCGTSTATSVEFKWDAVTGATSYDVSYTINGAGTPLTGTNVTSPYTVTGLNVGDNVSLTVTPKGSANDCFEASSQTCQVSCVPINITTSNISNTKCQGSPGTGNPISLPSAKEIYTADQSKISYAGFTNVNVVSITIGGVTNTQYIPNGRTFSRIPDAGSWQRNKVGTIDGANCNDCSNTPPPICNPAATGIILNEVLAQPLGTGCPNSDRDCNEGLLKKEYIELYNPTCGPLDISGFMVATATENIISATDNTKNYYGGFTVRIPKGTILQPGAFYVIGSANGSSDPNNIDLKIEDLPASEKCILRTYDVNKSQFVDNPVMQNGDGWVALYDGSGKVQDAIYWTLPPQGQNRISTSDDLDDAPCKLLESVPGTCNGSVTATVSGDKEDYTFEWKDADGNAVGPVVVNTINGTTTATINDLCAGNYTVTITEKATGCTGTKTETVTGNITQVTPEFDPVDPLCSGATAPVLPTTSKNNITGTWSPAVVDNQNTTTYTFTPDAGQCASTATLTITVNPKEEPLFDPVAGFCQGAILPQVLLPTTSNNGITGTWNPPALSSDVAGDILYVFTPTAGVCADTASLIVKVTANTTPTFSIGTSLTICAGGNVPPLSATSDNGVTGTWSPLVVSNTQGGVYTFTPDAGQCATTTTFTVTVNQPVTPTFTYGTTLTVCSGDPTPNLQVRSTNNVVGLWNPTNVSNTQSDVYTFTPAPGSCATTATFTVTVIQRPNVTVRPDITIYHNAVYPGDIFSGLPTGSTVSWTNSNISIGLPASGTGNVPAFTAINNGSSPVTATITVNSTNGNCAGTVRTYKITVLPLNRDVFVPNVFTPNGDAKNDQLFVFGNYITKLEMRIFNQWGELVKVINNPSVGWDGTHKGKPQPVGVYVYTLRATLADGTEVNKKGSITLLR